MKTILFYEKPGCVNNARQKQLLQEAGYQVDARNLLAEVWTAERLTPFFGGLPVADWFNRSAPQIKGGLVIPELLDAGQAMQLLLMEPLLIRRPLMQIGEQRLIGFETDQVNQALAISWSENETGELERCLRHVGSSCMEREV